MNTSKNLRIIGVNSAGINSKTESFNDVLKRLEPYIWCLQETKLKPKNTIKCDEVKKFQIYYLSRKNSDGGGIAVGVNKDIESTLIREGDDEVEVLVVLVDMGILKVRLITAYGPQENALKEKKTKFWNFLEEETSKAEFEGQGLIIQMDGNLHAGPKIVPKDPNCQNQNGKLFGDFVERNPFLLIGNNLDVCTGDITRKRVLESRTEQAILDFFCSMTE